jgi:hypothetical protein
MFGRKRVGGHMYACTKITAQSDRQWFQGDSFRRNDTNGGCSLPSNQGALQNALVVWALHVGDLVPKIAVPPFP